jgi:hypothetical protein
MFIQAGSNSGIDPSTVLTSFVTTMVGLSVATERVTQMIKQWIAKWVTASPWAIHCFSFLVGIGVVMLSGQDPIGIQGFTKYGFACWQSWVSWILSGLLVSGGSAFWNHALDLVQAAKVQKETAVNAALPAGQKIPA